MKFTSLFAPTLREDPKEAEVISHRLMLRAGMIRRLTAGVYELLPLGFKVIQKIENIVRDEMNRAGGQELLLPALLPAELWHETGRWGIYGKELMRIKDRHERDYCLGPTHEEVITDLVRNEVKSYRQLPINLYQIQTKFRDEIRPRFGLMRGREFIMKDSYSFDRDEEGLRASYKKMEEAYRRIFDRCGLKYKVVEADPGPIGGGFSQEFMVLSDTGEDEIMHCDKCDYAASHEMARFKGAAGDPCPVCEEGKLVLTRGIEVGHIFQLGTKYSDKMKATFLDEDGKEKPFIMGCYGIGIGRTAAASIEQSNDKDGIIWPISIAPYQAVVVPVNVTEQKERDTAIGIYEKLLELNIEVLYDDRDERIGVRLKDIDLIGIPIKVIIGPKGLAQGKAEIKMRATGETKLVDLNTVAGEVRKLII